MTACFWFLFRTTFARKLFFISFSYVHSFTRAVCSFIRPKIELNFHLVNAGYKFLFFEFGSWKSVWKSKSRSITEYYNEYDITMQYDILQWTFLYCFFYLNCPVFLFVLCIIITWLLPHSVGKKSSFYCVAQNLHSQIFLWQAYDALCIHENKFFVWFYSC